MSEKPTKKVKGNWKETTESAPTSHFSMRGNRENASVAYHRNDNVRFRRDAIVKNEQSRPKADSCIGTPPVHMQVIGKLLLKLLARVRQISC